MPQSRHKLQGAGRNQLHNPRSASCLCAKLARQMQEVVLGRLGHMLDEASPPALSAGDQGGEKSKKSEIRLAKRCTS